MQELDDIALLRQYTEQNSEVAFATFIRSRCAILATFVTLAKKARHFGKGVVLAGWLYQTARLTAVTFIRSEIRRARREQESHANRSKRN